MIRPPPRSTRTDTPFPYPTLFRSNHKVSEERISSGIADLDAMLSGGGFHRGSSILVSGVAGAGKSSVAASIVDAACSRGEKALYFSFEESEFQTVRNMRSIGIDLQKWVEAGDRKSTRMNSSH